jgi:hypothetical protein
LNHKNCKCSSFDLSLQFNGYPIAELKLNCKKIGFTAKREFIESKKKEIVAFHLNNNLFITTGWQNHLTIGTNCQF